MFYNSLYLDHSNKLCVPLIRETEMSPLVWCPYAVLLGSWILEKKGAKGSSSPGIAKFKECDRMPGLNEEQRQFGLGTRICEPVGNCHQGSLLMPFAKNFQIEPEDNNNNKNFNWQKCQCQMQGPFAKDFQIEHDHKKWSKTSQTFVANTL